VQLRQEQRQAQWLQPARVVMLTQQLQHLGSQQLVLPLWLLVRMSLLVSAASPAQGYMRCCLSSQEQHCMLQDPAQYPRPLPSSLLLWDLVMG
jgi:hypothetical protein